ncbi:MAG: DNA polymerase/3'-5' exonuclease PolX [Planctomycetales bacterium]|nr:DNA polymerase/3'-5' exonuclease PolX [Planctomycetales bacterium]
MTNKEIAATFETIADLLEFTDANPFRVRAYRNGARTIAELDEPITSILQDASRQLTDISGIGKDLAAKCATLVETGNLPMLVELLEQVPASVLAILRVPGLGPKKAAVLHNELGINTLEELADACQAGKIRTLKGFGAKTEESILKGIAIAAAAEQRVYWSKADELVQELLKHFDACQAVQKKEMAGSYRRGKETVGDLDLLVASDDSAAVMRHFEAFPRLAEVLVRGETKMSIRVDSGLQIDLRVVPQKSFGAALQYFTGSKEHNVILRGRAKQLGLRVNEYGVFRVDDREANSKSHDDKADVDANNDAVNNQTAQYLAGKAEKEVYATLGLPLFPPEIREGRREFEWADAGALPKLITIDDIRGDLHMHTDATDGKATLDEMVAAARERGLEYIAITDHSQRVAMAGGLDAKRLLAQWTEVDRINAAQGDNLQVLKGIECDILEDGQMDLPDEVLEQADWVVASVHYGQQQSRAQITERILGALEHPYVSIIAHPTGRLINRRAPYEVDMDAVFTTAKKHRKMLELNANPARLDLHDIHCAAAKAHGIPIVISTDAHSVSGLDVMRYGILQARRGGLTKKDVANTLPWSKFRKLLKRS